MSDAGRNCHIICERDVGLFSLLQQVVATVPWALAEGRTPVAYYSHRCCYWTPAGFKGHDSVWEYYFEPLVADAGADTIPAIVKETINGRFPSAGEIGYRLDGNIWVSSHFGDHPALKGKTLTIPYEWDDPGAALRRVTARLIRAYVRPRAYIRERVADFFDRRMRGHSVVGVHVRGTDAVSAAETRLYRQGSLVLENYVRAIGELLTNLGDAQILVATDDAHSLAHVREAFGDRVIAYDSIRHESGPTTGAGPTGWLMPGYIAGDRERAAHNGAEAVIEYLLLCRCRHLVHNGASLARTVLLTCPDLDHTNVHQPNKLRAHLRSLRRLGIIGAAKKVLKSTRV